jgi:NAD(P)-dependent dehydrogenase (short-subunit alcohol dehydrogenase family)
MLSAVGDLAPSLALEPAPVRVNAVTPGVMGTPRFHTADGLERDPTVQNRAAMLPARRVGPANEVAQGSLVPMTNAYLTSEVVHVDGSGRFVSDGTSESVHR